MNDPQPRKPQGSPASVGGQFDRAQGSPPASPLTRPAADDRFAGLEATVADMRAAVDDGRRRLFRLEQRAVLSIAERDWPGTQQVTIRPDAAREMPKIVVGLSHGQSVELEPGSPTWDAMRNRWLQMDLDGNPPTDGMYTFGAADPDVPPSPLALHPGGRFERDRSGSGIPALYADLDAQAWFTAHERRTIDEWAADTDSVRIVDELGNKKRDFQSWAYTAETAGFKLETVPSGQLRDGDLVFVDRSGKPDELVAVGGPAGPTVGDGRRAVCFQDHGNATVTDIVFGARTQVRRIRRND